MERQAEYQANCQTIEYLTPEQVKQVNEAIRAILDSTGAGEIVIRINNHHPKYIGYTVWNKFEKPEA